MRVNLLEEESYAAKSQLLKITTLRKTDKKKTTFDSLKQIEIKFLSIVTYGTIKMTGDIYAQK